MAPETFLHHTRTAQCRERQHIAENDSYSHICISRENYRNCCNGAAPHNQDADRVYNPCGHTHYGEIRTTVHTIHTLGRDTHRMTTMSRPEWRVVTPGTLRACTTLTAVSSCLRNCTLKDWVSVLFWRRGVKSVPVDTAHRSVSALSRSGHLLEGYRQAALTLCACIVGAYSAHRSVSTLSRNLVIYNVKCMPLHYFWAALARCTGPFAGSSILPKRLGHYVGCRQAALSLCVCTVGAYSQRTCMYTLFPTACFPSDELFSMLYPKVD
jgi:hypothetical protein